MAARGTKRKPDNLHLLKGTHRKDRHGTPGDKVQLPLEEPECPSELGDIAKAEWRRIVPILRDMGVLSIADRSTMSQYCSLWDQFIQSLAQSYLDDDGDEVKPPNFTAAQHLRLTSTAAELYITPASRSKLERPTKKGNEFDDI